MLETYEQQMEDSNVIFTAMSNSGCKTFKEAEELVVMAYVMDMSYSRSGISHALKRLERHYREGQ